MLAIQKQSSHTPDVCKNTSHGKQKWPIGKYTSCRARCSGSRCLVTGSQPLGRSTAGQRQWATWELPAGRNLALMTGRGLPTGAKWRSTTCHGIWAPNVSGLVVWGRACRGGKRLPRWAGRVRQGGLCFPRPPGKVSS